MTADWSPLARELARWRAEGRALPLWWRDDDAVAPTPALEQLMALSDRLGLPLHLAVIPEPATEALADICRGLLGVVPMVHGWAHANHAAQGQKKAEFGAPREGQAKEAAAGLARLRALFDDDLLAVFVPPWNRLDAALLPALAGMGFAGISTFTPRAARLEAPGLVQINAHVDPIDWRGGGGLLPEDALLARITETLAARRTGATDATEPLGLLTHHLVHDAALWDFTARFIAMLLDAGALPVNLRDQREDLP